jgi:hypothetical protein
MPSFQTMVIHGQEDVCRKSVMLSGISTPGFKAVQSEPRVILDNAIRQVVLTRSPSIGQYA